MRQIVLDTETTGLETAAGHRLIEVGATELVNRRPTGNVFHRYLNPEREIDEGATAVHGIHLAQLLDEPKFAEIADELMEFLRGAELIIHNAPFDIGFIEHELRLMKYPRPKLDQQCAVLDTLVLARDLHPGQRNSLDALCRRYGIDNSKRDVHGALLDANLLADVYLAMTGGQADLGLEQESGRDAVADINEPGKVLRDDVTLKLISVSDDELSQHDELMRKIAAECPDMRAWPMTNSHRTSGGSAD